MIGDLCAANVRVVGVDRLSALRSPPLPLGGSVDASDQDSRSRYSRGVAGRLKHAEQFVSHRQASGTTIFRIAERQAGLRQFMGDTRQFVSDGLSEKLGHGETVLLPLVGYAFTDLCRETVRTIDSGTCADGEAMFGRHGKTLDLQIPFAVLAPECAAMKSADGHPPRTDMARLTTK